MWGFKQSRNRRNRPIEWLALQILRYLANSPSSAYTVTHLMRINGIGWQRRDRVKLVLWKLCEFKWIERIKQDDRTSYRVTEEGLWVYWRLGHKLIDLIESLRFGPSKYSREHCERCGNPFDSGKHRDVGRPGSAEFTVEHYLDGPFEYIAGIIRREAEIRGFDPHSPEIKRFLERMEREAVTPEEELRPRRVCLACHRSEGFDREERYWLELQQFKMLYKWLQREVNRGCPFLDEGFLEWFLEEVIQQLETMVRGARR